MNIAERYRKDNIPDPWSYEPDELSFDYRGYQCQILRNNFMGFLCGYVAVYPSSRFSGASSDELDGLEVHGGVTFTGFGEQIQRLPSTINEQRVWWIGFDCGHAGDFVPKVPAFLTSIRMGKYRTIEYVQGECRRLVDQIIVLEARDE